MIFKKTIFSLALALISVMSAHAQNADECIIDAILNGVPDGTEMEAVLAATHRNEKPLAKGVVKGGKLTLTIPVTEARFIGVGPRNGVFTFSLMTKGGEKVQVSLDAKPINDGVNTGFYTSNVKISGSAMNDEYQTKIGSVRDMLDKMYKDINDKHKKLIAEQSKAYQAKDKAKMKALEDSDEGKEMATEQKNFFDTVESSYGKLLNEQINPKGLTGETLPQFELQQVDGSKVSMASCVKGKKYYLVDFWASWCGPCRKEIPNLKKLYELYKGKGLEIVSVSIDKNETAWKKALAEEKLSWPNGLDRAGIADSYKVKFIPAIFLVDGTTGKCIAENVRGTELAAKLAELFSK